MNVNVQWQYPAQRADGSATNTSELLGVKLEISLDGVSWGVLREAAQLPPSVTSYLQTELEFGTWHFRGTVVDKFGQEGEPLTASITVLPAAPGQLATLTLTPA